MKTDKNSRTHTTSGTDTHPEQAFPSRKPADVPLPQREYITYEKWLLKYRPIKNPNDRNASFDGYMFETYGPDFEFICTSPDHAIWTMLDCDGRLRICEGYHFVNRIGYFVTEVPYPSNRTFCIKAD